MALVPLNAACSFVGGYVLNRDTFRIIAQLDELNLRQAPNTTLFKLIPSQQKRFAFSILWTVIKIVTTEVPTLLAVAVGPDGRVGVGTAGSNTEEQIGTSAEGPQIHGLITDLRLIGNAVIACGMGRQVYQRTAPGTWTPLHTQILQPPSLTEVRGFNAIHGLDVSEMIAVGWYGEIYRRRGTRWNAEDSGTNLILNDVHVAPHGTAFACGQLGTLLRNSGAGWERVDHGATRDEIRSMQWFAEQLFLATDTELFRLDAHDSLQPVKVAADGKSTFDSLHANDGVMLSVGTKDIWWTEDAKTWNRLD